MAGTANGTNVMNPLSGLWHAWKLATGQALLEDLDPDLRGEALHVEENPYASNTTSLGAARAWGGLPGLLTGLALGFQHAAARQPDITKGEAWTYLLLAATIGYQATATAAGWFYTAYKCSEQNRRNQLPSSKSCVRASPQHRQDLNSQYKKALAAIAQGPDAFTQAVAGLDVNELSKERQGVLMGKAVESRRMDVFNAVLGFVNDPNILVFEREYWYTPLVYAVRFAKSYEIALALAKNPQVDLKDAMWFIDYCISGLSGTDDIVALQAIRYVIAKRTEEHRSQQRHWVEKIFETPKAPPATWNAEDEKFLRDMKIKLDKPKPE